MAAEKDKRRNGLVKKAFARLFNKQADVLSESQRRVTEEAEDIERDAARHLDDIRSGGRSFKRPFRS